MSKNGSNPKKILLHINVAKLVNIKKYKFPCLKNLFQQDNFHKMGLKVALEFGNLLSHFHSF